MSYTNGKTNNEKTNNGMIECGNGIRITASKPAWALSLIMGVALAAAGAYFTSNPGLLLTYFTQAEGTNLVFVDRAISYTSLITGTVVAVSSIWALKKLSEAEDQP